MHDQYRNRTSGDNGVSKNLVALINGLDVWLQKMNTQLDLDNIRTSRIKLNEVEWQSFHQNFEEWQEYLLKSINLIGSPLKESLENQKNYEVEEEVPLKM